MIPLNKRPIQSKKILRAKTNISSENSNPSFDKITRTLTPSNNQNTRYLHQNNQNNYNNRGDIKEIDIKNIPTKILYNHHQRNKRANYLMQNKTNTSYSNENISDISLQKFQNNTFTQRTIETYEIPLGRNYYLNQQIFNPKKNRENKSMDITYYKPIIYINKTENNNSFCKKSENSEFFTQNNSFFMNGTNMEDNNNIIQNINLNNTIDYNKEKYFRQKK